MPSYIDCAVGVILNGSNPQTIGLMVLAGKGFTINGIRLMASVYIAFQYLTSYSAYHTSL